MNTKHKVTIFTLSTLFAGMLAGSQVYADTVDTSAKTDSTVQETSTDKNQSVSLTSNTDKISYAIGADIGRNFKNLDVPLNPQLLAQGVKDTLEGNPTLMNQKDIQATLVSFQKELIVKRQENLQKTSAKNKTEEEKFLADNKSKPGVVTLSDGLQYKILKDGKGDSPKATDTVIVNYEGTLPNGQVFDSSYAKGKPVTFPVERVIPGWIEVLKLMKPGSVWMVYVPSALAYGDHGMGPIEANQLLIFKIELIAIQPPVATPSSIPTSNEPSTNKK